jgi:demethylmenaquinone methyltransferase / 2-methoxy-6-polyprenyl-1,4-benzoquinol methylase
MTRYHLDPGSIRRLFNSVAPRYDFLNHLLSLRRDVSWRREAIRELNGFHGFILDVATGTADLAIEALSQEGSSRSVVGLDFSEAMLRGAQKKLRRKNLSSRVLLGLGDAVSLPFRDGSFKASMIAFGLRNIPEKERALCEMVRVTQEGGRIVILEFTLPRKGIMKILYPLYFTKILPWVGGRISGDRGAYAYLPESVFRFRYSEDYEELMRRSGLDQVHSQPLTFGIVSLMAGTKRQR